MVVVCGKGKMLLLCIGINACVAVGTFFIPMEQWKTILLASLIGLFQFIILKQFRAACSLWAWLWFFIQQKLIPNPIVPDILCALSLVATAIGVWVGLGVERNRYDGSIRPGLIVMTFALYILPFQVRLSDPVELAVFSLWFFSVYAMTCWVKDQLEEEAVTVFYFVISTYWVLIADPHWTFIIARVVYTALLSRVVVIQLMAVDPIVLLTKTTHPPPATKPSKSHPSRQTNQKKRKNNNNNNTKKEFTLSDGYQFGLKLLEEDELISVMVDERFRLQKTRYQNGIQHQTTTVIAKDDPGVLENETKFAF